MENEQALKVIKQKNDTIDRLTADIDSLEKVGKRRSEMIYDLRQQIISSTADNEKLRAALHDVIHAWGGDREGVMERAKQVLNETKGGE